MAFCWGLIKKKCLLLFFNINYWVKSRVKKNIYTMGYFKMT